MATTPTAKTHKGEDGNYTPARRKLHEDIMFNGWTDKDGKRHEGILSPERVKAATPAKGEKPVFTILGGRGGSGKSSFDGKKHPEVGVYDPSKAIVLDSDEIKKALPEYAGWNANEVHDESGDVFDAITAIAAKKGLNLVHDATMKSPEKAVKLVKDMKGRGYGVAAHYMHLPRQEAAKRAVERFLGKTRRLVPPEVVLSNVKNEAAFDDVKKLADKWSFWDNNVSHGQPPRLISRSQGKTGDGED
jgi:predicted ABC-type ATPase